MVYRYTPAVEFRRDRLTWLAYALLAWFAYLQAAPGLVVAHLRDELDLSYSAGGLHVAAFAAGSVLAGSRPGAVERALGRYTVFWSSAAVMGAGRLCSRSLTRRWLTIGPLRRWGRRDAAADHDPGRARRPSRRARRSR